jgi:DNA polymerase III subunit gamma/tau
MVPARELQAHLRQIATAEKIKVSDEALGRISRAAEGSVRDALSLFDQVLAYSGDEVLDKDLQALLGLIDRELLTTASRAVAEADSLALLQLAERLADAGADYRNFVRELLLHFREILLLKVAPADSALVAQVLPEERERLAAVVALYSEEDLLRIFDVLTKIESELRWAQDPRVVLEMALLKLVQLRRLVPFAELVDRVERLASGAPPVARSVPAPAPNPRPTIMPVAAASRSPVASAPPPPAAPAPTPAPSGGPGDLLSAMIAAAAKRPSLLQGLRLAQAQVEGDTVRLTMPPPFAQMAEDHIDEYRQLASQAAGRPLKVQIGMGGAVATAEPEPAPVDTRRQSLMQQAAREPVVQEAMELFGGRLVNVREEPPTPGSRGEAKEPS